MENQFQIRQVVSQEVRVKSNSQDWFDAEINEEIERQDKLLTKFKSPDPTAIMKTIKSHGIKSNV